MLVQVVITAGVNIVLYNEGADITNYVELYSWLLGNDIFPKGSLMLNLIQRAIFVLEFKLRRTYLSYATKHGVSSTRTTSTFGKALRILNVVFADQLNIGMRLVLCKTLLYKLKS